MLKRPHGMRLLFFCTAGLALALLPECVVGQISNITNTTVAPTPGSGHDYLGGVNDIVNPANGLPSVRIGLNTAAGRGLSVPLALSYNAGDVWILNSNTPDNVVIESAQKIASNQSGTSSPWTAGGWSITVPRLTQAAGSIDVPDPSNVTGYNPIKTCLVTTNFMFMDQAGGQHPLHMAYDSGNEGWPCDSLSVMTGGDDFVQSHIDSSYNVVDNQGTVYNFTLHKTPDFIEDRNGNRVLVTANDQTGAFDVTDALNRKTVSVDGFGSGTNNVTVSGAGTYRLVWDTITVNLTFNSWNQGYDEFKRAPFRWELLQGGGTIQVIKEIDLPNNTKYQFQYDQYGLLTQISYPGGGWVKYTYTTNEQSEIFGLLMRTECCDPNLYPDDYWHYAAGYIRYSWPVVRTRSLSFNGVDVAMVQTFSYSTSWPNTPLSNWTAKSTSVTAQDLVIGNTTKTVYQYSASGDDYNGAASTIDPFIPSGSTPQEQSISYQDGNGNTLRTVNKTWLDLFLLASEQTVTKNGQNSLLTYTYDTGGLIKEQDEYDFGQSTPTRRTVTTHHSFPATSLYSWAPSIFDRPDQVAVYDGNSSTPSAETDYIYDEGGVGAPIANLTGHDEMNYAPGSLAPRGNVTTEIHKCFIPSTGATCPDSVIHYTYDETGQVLSKTDAVGNITNFSYTDNYSDMVPPGNTNAYLTTITYPTTSANGVSHSEAYAYAYSDGQLTVARDQNFQQTHYTYNDSLRRLTEADYPNGGQTIYGYVDTPYAPGSNTPYTFRQDRTVDANTVTTSWTQFDGMGRAIRSAKLNGEGSPNIVDDVDTCYDGLGQKIYQTYPYQMQGWLPNTYHCPPDSSPVGDRFTYDPLGRLTTVTHPDNSAVSTDYSQFPMVTVTDEAGRARRSQVDALGRMLTVWEPDANGNFAYETDYQYDTLDNLLRVDQKGGSSDSTQWRTRNFVYDSLSRLLTATNPESGTIQYSYDPNGNLLFKTSPTPNQTNPAATITYRFGYDELNRLIWRWSLNQTSDPVDRYWYDLSSVWGTTVHHPIGRLVLGQSDGGSKGSVGTIHSYDVMGRPEFELEYNKRGDNTVNKQFNYSYNLDGSLSFITYPSGREVDYRYNLAQRPITATDTIYDISFVSIARYTAWGALNYMVNGMTDDFAGIVTSNNYNPRMQPNELWTAAGNRPPVLDLVYDYYSCSGGNNGNVCRLVNNKDNTRTQSFAYDPLNRLTSATSGNWSQSYGYDIWGNLLHKTAAGGDTPLDKTVTVKNQVDSWCYDAAGNVVDPTRPCPNPPPTSNPNVYDGQNRLTSATIGANTTSYDYDADGRRVKKSGGSTNTLYWYGLGGEVLEETDLSGNLQNEYIFFGGKRIARYNPTARYSYYFSDHLGSADVVTDASGNIKEESDFYPFGGERVVTDLGLDNRYKFTGKERDPETGCDFFGARYYCNSIGRFLSVDPTMDSARFQNPQSWNRYTYVVNNPLAYIDPDGELWIDSGDANNPYSWVDQCGEGQTCYNAVATAVGSSLRIYGSNNAKDITNIAGNQYGMVDLNDINKQHDAAFDVKTTTDYPYVSLKTGADFFNFVNASQQNYPGAPDLYVTEAGAFDGSSVPGHQSHKDGMQIDMRYVDDEGNSVQGKEAYNSADSNRMWDLMRMSRAAGLTQIYAGDESEWGDFSTRPSTSPHEDHWHISIPNPGHARPHTPHRARR